MTPAVMTPGRYDSGHCGVRIGGHRFWIGNVTTWDLVDAEGARHGKAAAFPSCSYL